MTSPNDEWGNLNFQRRRRKEKEDSAWAMWVWIALAVIGVAMLLIEWNARRQAAAQVREWTRPITPEQQAEMDASLNEFQQKLQRENDADMARVRRDVLLTFPTPSQQVDHRPLADGERCISHQRFQRIENGWNQIGTC